MKNILYSLFVFVTFISVVFAQDNYPTISERYPQTFDFLKSLPKDSVVLTWIDEGKEIIDNAQLEVVSAYPSPKLVEIGAFAGGYSGPTESDEKLVDISTFFITTDEKTASSIARKYNVRYILVTHDILFKQHWIQGLATSCEPYSECPKYAFIQSTDPNLEQIRNSPEMGELIEISGGYYLVPNELKNTIFNRMYFEDNSLDNFKLVYSDSGSRIYEVPQDLIIIYIAIFGIMIVITAIILIKKQKK